MERSCAFGLYVVGIFFNVIYLWMHHWQIERPTFKGGEADGLGFLCIVILDAALLFVFAHNSANIIPRLWQSLSLTGPFCPRCGCLQRPCKCDESRTR